MTPRAHRPWLLLLLAIAAPLVAHACRIATATWARPSAVSGCEMVVTRNGGLECHLPGAARSHAVVVWLEGQDVIEAQARLLTPWAHGRLAVEREFVDWGTRVVVHVDGGGMLEITGVVDEAGRTVRRQWAVRLVQRPATPRLDRIAARWAAPDGPSHADELLERLRRLAIMAPPWQAARAWELRSAIHRRVATPQAALDDLERALATAGPEELSLRCRVRRKTVDLHLIEREDHHAAETVMDAMTECEALGARHRAPMDHLRGTLALRRSDVSAAIEHLRRATAGAEQLRLPGLGMEAAGLLAVAEARAHRFEAAAAALRRARRFSRALELDCEDELSLAGKAAAVAVLRPREPGAADPEGLAGFELPRGTCRTSNTMQALTVLYVAYALQRGGQHVQAQRWLDQLDGLELRPVQRMYRASIAADAALGRGDVSAASLAVEALARLLDRHPHEASVELQVQRDLVRARVARARGSPGIAREHLRRAIERQGEQLQLVPLGLSTSRASAKEAEPARFLVELLREQGELEAALCTARLLRNRAGRVLMGAARLYAQGHARYEQLAAHVRQREQAFEQADREGSAASLARAKAELRSAQLRLLSALTKANGLTDRTPERACATLPEPAAGELALLFHEDPHGRWWLFDWTPDEPVRIHDLGLGPPSSSEDARRVVKRLLHPVRDRLARASGVRLLTSGPTNELVFEALPWEGGTLEQRFDVTWALDLPPRPAPARAAAAAVQVADDPEPTLRPVVVYTDLYHEFRRVAPQVETLLRAIDRAWGEHVLALVDERSSTRDLRSLSGGAMPLVVIGHNSALDELDVDNPRCGRPRSASATEDPARVEAPERPTPGVWIGHTSMGLDTVLTLDPPRVAILESCATGPVDALSLDGPVGLGHAMIAAGTEQVLVTRRNVCPKQALSFLTALVEASAHEPLELPRLLRAARHEDPDYLHRVLVP